MKLGMKGKSVKPGKTKTFLAAIVAVFVVMPCLAGVEGLIAEIIVRACPWLVAGPAALIVGSGEALSNGINTDSRTNAVTSCWTPISLDAANYRAGHYSIPWCFADVYGLDVGLACSSCGDLAGVQVNPLFALTQNAYGLQCSGLVAKSYGEADGIFVGGFGSGVRYLRGLQVAGLMAYAQEAYGCQVSLLNRTRDDMYGFQVGLASGGGNVYGLQVGVANFCDNLHGLQIGVYNDVRESGNGLQIGAVNVAESGSMLQIGVVNYVRLPSALQIGLFNLIGEGRSFKHQGCSELFGSRAGYPLINFAW